MAPRSFTATWKVRTVGVPPATWISGTWARLWSSMVRVRRRSSRRACASASAAEAARSRAPAMRSGPVRLLLGTGSLLGIAARGGGMLRNWERREAPLLHLEAVGAFHRRGDDALHELH